MSYWRNLVLCQKLFGLLLAYAAGNVSRALTLLLAGFFCASLVWSYVGTWRSASNYSASTTKIWGHIAQTSMSVGLLLIFAKVFG